MHEQVVNTVGGVIGAGEELLKIIPLKHGLEIEVRIEPQFIDQIYIGQSVNCIFTAFDSRNSPEVNGEISTISADVSTDSSTGFQYYTIGVYVSPKELGSVLKKDLIPGMPVDVFARTGDRSPISYLLKPLTDQINRAWRER